MSSTHEPRLARVAAMVADPARSRMLAYLLSGECASAGELAKVASVSGATASGHLGKLLDARFLVCEARGRHRYYRLADAEVAHVLEALALVAERGDHDRAWGHPQRQHLRFARCCYGHMAGRLGVAVFDALRLAGGLKAAVDGYQLTPEGRRWLAELGLQPSPPTGRRRYAYPCLDWSERRDHLAGKLAAAMLAHFVAQGWLQRRPGERALRLTTAGRHALESWLRAGPLRQHDEAGRA